MTGPTPALSTVHEQVAEAVERAVLAAISKAAVAWGMPLLDILNTEGHDQGCDALAADNLTLCDCWWGRLKTATQGLSMVATAAEEQLTESAGSPDVVDVLDSIADALALAQVAETRWAVEWIMRGPHPTRHTGQFSTFNTREEAESLMSRSHVLDARLLRRTEALPKWQSVDTEERDRE